MALRAMGWSVRGPDASFNTAEDEKLLFCAGGTPRRQRRSVCAVWSLLGGSDDSEVFSVIEWQVLPAEKLSRNSIQQTSSRETDNQN
jgi:hypothetical protein